MTLKRLGAAVVLAGLSGAASSALVTNTFTEQGVSVEMTTGFGHSFLPTFPYQQLSVEASGLTWDCASGACSLNSDARVDVVMRSAEGARTVQIEGEWSGIILNIQSSVQGFSVQDPLGATWTLLPDLADWHYGIHITENLRPDDVQFVATYGVLEVSAAGIYDSFATSFTSQTGWIEVGPSIPQGSELPTADALASDGWAFIFNGRGQLITAAPVYGLASLDPECMSADCMRYERGTLMIDAHRLSFGVQAVAAVPEPATWATMALGLLALGAVARRHAS